MGLDKCLKFGSPEADAEIRIHLHMIHYGRIPRGDGKAMEEAGQRKNGEGKQRCDQRFDKLQPDPSDKL